MMNQITGGNMKQTRYKLGDLPIDYEYEEDDTKFTMDSFFVYKSKHQYIVINWDYQRGFKHLMGVVNEYPRI